MRVPRTDVHPFTLEEVNLIIDTVRADFRNYLTVRFFTGMRTAEINGLKWNYVDFDKDQILVRETWVGNRLRIYQDRQFATGDALSLPSEQPNNACRKATGIVSVRSMRDRASLVLFIDRRT